MLGCFHGHLVTYLDTGLHGNHKNSLFEDDVHVSAVSVYAEPTEYLEFFFSTLSSADPPTIKTILLGIWKRNDVFHGRIFLAFWLSRSGHVQFFP